jgi:gluconolactonase
MVIPISLLLTTFGFQASDGSRDLKALVQPGAELRLLSSAFEFTEGPTADPDGNVYFTDQPNDRILKWDLAGNLSTFMQPAGRSNGLYFHGDGIVACADDKNQLWRISLDGQVEILVRDYQGKLLNGPNDAWVRPDGGIYFTDPYYRRPYWQRGEPEQDQQAVYFLPADRSRLLRVAGDLVQPNGIVGTPDGKTLYVADIRAGKTWAYTIASDGTLSDKSLFCEMGSDGMTIDQQGNLYLTGKGVTVFDPHGSLLGTLEVPEPWTANVCFGGPGWRTLFITASKSLYAIEMSVPGVRPAR